MTRPTPTPAAVQARIKLASDFRRRGIIVALLSGVLYGFYTTFMTLGMSKGPWTDWYGVNTAGLSAFVITYILSALGAAITDSCSAIWALGMASIRGKIGDFFRCIRTKPGITMITAALIGGPVSSTFYVIGLQKSGAIVVPISALCPVIGTILSRFLFKQKLNDRIVIGISICFIASLMIGSVGFSEGAPNQLLTGIFFGFLAAIGWGLEGCVCGYTSAIIDSEIGITIRQVTSGITNFIILLPILSLLSGDSNTFNLVVQSLSSSESMILVWSSRIMRLFIFHVLV